MPISVDYTPAGLAMGLAKKAGRAKGRTVSAQIKADADRLNVAREGQILQAQTAQRKMDAEDRRFEITSALKLMDQKSLHEQRMLGEQTAMVKQKQSAYEFRAGHEQEKELAQLDNDYETGQISLKEYLRLQTQLKRGEQTGERQQQRDENNYVTKTVAAQLKRQEEQANLPFGKQSLVVNTRDQVSMIEGMLKSLSDRKQSNLKKSAAGYETTDPIDPKLHTHIVAREKELTTMLMEKLDALTKYQENWDADRPLVPHLTADELRAQFRGRGAGAPPPRTVGGQQGVGTVLRNELPTTPSATGAAAPPVSAQGKIVIDGGTPEVAEFFEESVGSERLKNLEGEALKDAITVWLIDDNSADVLTEIDRRGGDMDYLIEAVAEFISLNRQNSE